MYVKKSCERSAAHNVDAFYIFSMSYTVHRLGYRLLGFRALIFSFASINKEVRLESQRYV